MGRVDPQVQRHVLVCVTGLAPSVITETLYGLSIASVPPLFIDEVFALTTRPGAARLREALLDPSPGPIQRLCADYDLPEIRFPPENIRLLTDAQGRPLDDITTAEDNASVADQIFAFVRHLTSLPDVRIHASIAGGRKTMGLYLGLAMQFYGRIGDSLSHVLIPPELESHPAFFYPPPSQDPATRQCIQLAEIPILFLRDKLPFLNEKVDLSYTELINNAQWELAGLRERPIVQVDALRRRLLIAGHTIPLTPLEIALYRIFAQRRQRCSVRCPGCQRCGISQQQVASGELRPQLLEMLEAMGARDPRYQDLKGWKTNHELTPIPRFFETLSRIRRKVVEGLGSVSWADEYTIQRLGSRHAADSLYRIPLPGERIEIL